jgi:hypothetical protein
LLRSPHWWLANAPQGDWAADLQNVVVGAPVRLYAAPQQDGMAITARVDTVGPACRSGAIADGGYSVTVSFWNGSTKIGSATYAHIDLTVGQGAWIDRWGTQLGTVGGGYRIADGCWG